MTVLTANRAEVIAKTIAKRQDEVSALEAKAAELEQREEQARLEAARTSPTQRIYSVDLAGKSSALRSRDDRRKVLQKVETLKLEIASLGKVYDEATAGRREEQQAELTKAATEFDKREKSAWHDFGIAYAALADTYSGVLAVVHERDVYHQGISWLDEQDREPIGALFQTVQTPFPADLVNALIAATDAAVDPRGLGRERAGYLAEAVPDLRGKVGNAKSIRGDKTGYRADPHQGYGSALGGSELGFGGGASPQGLAGHG